tara:strand:+ start:105 stop:377 length:273 start_codon:yes stop_codon:yes gene_type:complete
MSNVTQDRREGFPSLYRFSSEYWWETKNEGFDYGEKLFKRTFSNYMFKNPNLTTFLVDYVQPIMVKYINTVKYLRIYFNFAVPKYYQKIN